MKFWKTWSCIVGKPSFHIAATRYYHVSDASPLPIHLTTNMKKAQTQHHLVNHVASLSITSGWQLQAYTVSVNPSTTTGINLWRSSKCLYSLSSQGRARWTKIQLWHYQSPTRRHALEKSLSQRNSGFANKDVREESNDFLRNPFSPERMTFRMVHPRNSIENGTLWSIILEINAAEHWKQPSGRCRVNQFHDIHIL